MRIYWSGPNSGTWRKYLHIRSTSWRASYSSAQVKKNELNFVRFCLAVSRFPQDVPAAPPAQIAGCSVLSTAPPAARTFPLTSVCQSELCRFQSSSASVSFDVFCLLLASRRLYRSNLGLRMPRFCVCSPHWRAFGERVTHSRPNRYIFSGGKGVAEWVTVRATRFRVQSGGQTCKRTLFAPSARSC